MGNHLEVEPMAGIEPGSPFSWAFYARISTFSSLLDVKPNCSAIANLYSFNVRLLKVSLKFFARVFDPDYGCIGCAYLGIVLSPISMVHSLGVVKLWPTGIVYRES